MTKEFVRLGTFDRDARRAGVTEEDVRAAELRIMEGPRAWPVVAGTGGLRKMRLAPEARGGGQSGGVRICYFLVDAAERVYLVAAFAKNQKGNLSAADRRAIGAVIRRIKAAHLKPTGGPS